MRNQTVTVMGVGRYHLIVLQRHHGTTGPLRYSTRSLLLYVFGNYFCAAALQFDYSILLSHVARSYTHALINE